MTDDTLTRLRDMEKAATPGPWTHRLNHKPYRIVAFGGKRAYDEGLTTADIEPADAALIVTARNTFPETLALVEACIEVRRVLMTPTPFAEAEAADAAWGVALDAWLAKAEAGRTET